nr:MAG TPA: hypothetical protein [Caudoviricetes sp.]
MRSCRIVPHSFLRMRELQAPRNPQRLPPPPPALAGALPGVQASGRL